MDAPYLSFGSPGSAVGLDVGEGIIIRFDEKAKEVVGLTMVGGGRRLEKYVKKGS
ncbi:MAG: DUF2283 domain-containing protein [Acidobacteria bacterium]|nr:DUF2283 domain-containing protein [Acidobacteriota bacterium]